MAEAFTFAEEIEKLDAADAELNSKNAKFRAFVLSKNFIEDYIGFEKLIGEFQDATLAAAEAAATPSQAQAVATQLLEALGQKPAQQQPQGQPTLENLKPLLETFTLPKALVAFTAILVCGVVVSQGLLPPLALLVVIGGCLAFAFAPQLKTLLEGLRSKEEEKEVSVENLGDWVSETISRMRAKYMSARFLLKVQSVPKEMVERFKELGMDEALVGRERYFNETLPHEFLSMSGEVHYACKKAVWARKQLLISAMVQSSQAQLTQRM